MSRITAALDDPLVEPDDQESPELQSLLDGIELLNKLEQSLADMQATLDQLTIKNL